MGGLTTLRRGRARLGALGLALALASACATRTLPPPPSVDAAAVQREISGAWVPVGAGIGGYAHKQFDPPVSLYATAWSLRTLKTLRASSGRLDPRSCARAINRALRGSGERLPAMERYHVAAQALTDLGEPVPATRIATGVRSLRHGTLYRIDPAHEPGWSATETAVRTLLLAHARPDGTLAEVTRRHLPTAGDGTTLQQWADHDLPLWQLADMLLPAAARAPFRARLNGLLGRIRAYLDGHADPYTLGVLADARAVARANGLPPPPVAASAYRSLTGPSGMVTGGPGGAPDPHLTYLAASMGVPAAPLLPTTLERAATSSGWPAFVAYTPDPESSFFALRVGRTWHAAVHERELAALVRRWLAEMVGVADEKRLSARPADAYYTLALARDLSVPVPGALNGRLTRTADTLARSSAPRANGAGLLWAVRLDRLLGTAPPARLATMAEQALGPAPATVQSLLLAYEAGRYTRDRNLSAMARGIAGRLRLPDGTCRAAAGTSAPDVRTTMAALAATGASARQRRAVLEKFTTRQGIWLLPRSSRENTRGLDTLYYGIGAIDAEA